MDTEKEATLRDYGRVLWKRRGEIIAVLLAVEIITLVVSLTMPKIYQSTASVLPPEIEKQGLGALSTFGLGRQLPDLFSGASTSDTIIAMLKSRRMAEDIVREFNLRRFYRKEYVIDAIKTLKNSTRISRSKEDVISIRVASKDRNLAARTANFYVANLNTMNDELELTSAKPIVRVLDVAKPAEKKWKPCIRKNLLAAGLLALTGAIFISFLREQAAGAKQKNYGSASKRND